MIWIRRAFVLLFWVFVVPCFAQDLSGSVTRVVDGDTVWVKDESGQTLKVRVFGIDAPELSQPFGDKAREFARRLLLNKEVEVGIEGEDRYGRVVARIEMMTTLDYAELAVGEGYAWWYRRYAQEEIVLEGLEQSARHRRVGLWANPKPIPPWQYRRGIR